VAVDYPKGEVVFTVNGVSDRVTFKPGRRSLASVSATLFGPNSADSSLTSFEGAIRSLTLDNTNRLFDAAKPDAGKEGVEGRGTRGILEYWNVGLLGEDSRFRSLTHHSTLPSFQPSTEVAKSRASGTSARTIPAGPDGRPLLRLTGDASAGVELPANERAAGDAVAFEFAFRLDGAGEGTLCAAGDAIQTARVLVRGGCVILRTLAGERMCGPAVPGAWQRLALLTRRDFTRVTLDANPPVELHHTPQATCLYLGEGYPQPAPQPADFAFEIDVASVRSRILRP